MKYQMNFETMIAKLMLILVIEFIKLNELNEGVDRTN